MRNPHRIAGRLIAAVATLTSFAPLARAQNRTPVTISDSGVMAENLTSSRDGAEGWIADAIRFWEKHMDQRGGPAIRVSSQERTGLK